MIPLATDTLAEGEPRVFASPARPGPPGAGGALDGLQPVTPAAKRWPALLGAALSAAMLAGLLWQLFHKGLGALGRSVPESPLYYLCFAAFFMTLPVFDYLIFRHLWKIPPAGLIALTKKRIANDVVVNYSGEAYFYAWARANARLVAAPFGAIKDVSILSAIAGNVLTLAMVAVVLALGHGLLQPDQFRGGVWSGVILIAISLPFVVFSRQVFSLPRGELWTVFWLHCVRIVISNFLIALAWHFAMPHVSLGTWVLLAAIRMLVSRLPIVPNKDMAFPLIVNLLIGGREAVVQLMAFGAALTLVINAALVAGFMIHGLVTKGKPW